MRAVNLFRGELRFLWKYGIAVLYIIFTVLYICLLTAIPASAREATASVLILTDPAAMGLFFMGAIILLEKSQRVESSLAVSPIRVGEYIAAKVLPLMLIGTLVGLVLGLFAGMKNLPLLLLGVALSSVLFSLCGLLVGANIVSLNSFVIATVPFEIVLCVPSLLYLFGVIKSPLWIFHPGVAAMRLIIGGELWYLSLLSIIVWIVPVYFLCRRAVVKSFHSMGGAKL